MKCLDDISIMGEIKYSIITSDRSKPNQENSMVYGIRFWNDTYRLSIPSFSNDRLAAERFAELCKNENLSLCGITNVLKEYLK